MNTSKCIIQYLYEIKVHLFVHQLKIFVHIFRSHYYLGHLTNLPSLKIPILGCCWFPCVSWLTTNSCLTLNHWLSNSVIKFLYFPDSLLILAYFWTFCSLILDVAETVVPMKHPRNGIFGNKTLPQKHSNIFFNSSTKAWLVRLSSFLFMDSIQFSNYFLGRFFKVCCNSL